MTRLHTARHIWSVSDTVAALQITLPETLRAAKLRESPAAHSVALSCDGQRIAALVPVAPVDTARPRTCLAVHDASTETTALHGARALDLAPWQSQPPHQGPWLPAHTARACRVLRAGR